MVKKFKNLVVDEQIVLDKQCSLAVYIQTYALEILKNEKFMQNTPALEFWQSLFQAKKAGEGKSIEQGYLRWPYAERIIYLAREFKQLDQRSQAYIIKAAEKAIWWRGDDIEQFRRIVQAHLSYRRLNADQRLSYRKHLMQNAKSSVNRFI